MFAFISSQEFIFNLFGIASMLTVILLSLTIVTKSQRINQLEQTIAFLKKSLEEMDEQAKLIVRTDLELNKTQEELDKRVNGLYALQQISQDISRTLNQEEIFSRITQEYIERIGFQKGIIFAENNTAQPCLKQAIGFEEEEIPEIEQELLRENIYGLIKEKNTPLSSLSQEEDTRAVTRAIIAITKLDSFVIAPISKKDGCCGFILLCNSSDETSITEGDKELVTILATQIGQALDNAGLFETVYSQQQELEKKVIARTKELTQALSEIQAVSKRKTDFVSAVSHELRTPLTSIKGYASILLSEKLGAIPPEVKERLEKINKHSDELTHMVNDLLDIARIESGKFEMRLEPLDITEMVATNLDLLAPQLKEKSILLKTNIPKGLSLALADKTQVSRVFINLISNAIKFIPEKSGLINISAFESSDCVQINISDNGIGMSQEDSEHIFDEFYRVDNAINQKVKGTGLGLSLVKNIINAHQGTIWVDSRPNQGATFSFILPRYKEV